MSQSDYTIADQDGASFLVDINAQLAAIVSNNSGATEPTTTYAYQWWADTSSGLLKQRNAANNAWITIGTLASANLGHALAGTNSDITALTSTGGIDIIGTNTNDNAAAGYVGEYISSDVPLASPLSLTSGDTLSVTSISLTAGDWDVSGVVSFIPAATTNQTLLIGNISLVNATLDATLGRDIRLATPPQVTGGTINSISTKNVRLSLSATTTVYLCALAVFTISTMTVYANISARRIR